MFCDKKKNLFATNAGCTGALIFFNVFFNIILIYIFSDKSESNDYDPYHRNPQYCHAENSCVWELEKMAGHFHPTVSLFAQQILKVGQPVSCWLYKPIKGYRQCFHYHLL